MIGLAFEKVHCTPRELLARMSSEEITEAMAHFQIENEDAEAERKAAERRAKSGQKKHRRTRH